MPNPWLFFGAVVLAIVVVGGLIRWLLPADRNDWHEKLVFTAKPSAGGGTVGPGTVRARYLNGRWQYRAAHAHERADDIERSQW